MYMDQSDRQRYLEILKRHLTGKRFEHSLGTEELAVKMAERFGVNACDAQIAGLLHDIAKNLTPEEKWAAMREYHMEIDEVSRQNPDILHGAIGAEMIRRECGIENEDILNAVRYHTTGRAGMSPLEEVIYIADLLERTRDFEGIEELRALAEKDLDGAMLHSLMHVIIYVIKKRKPVDRNSIEAYNHLLFKIGRITNAEKI